MKTRSSTPLKPTSTSTSVDYSLFGGAEILPPSLSHISSSSSPPSTSSTTSSSDSETESETISYSGETKKGRAGDPWLPTKIEGGQDTNDFLWMMNEEPHRSRRRAILKAHPEINKLMGHEPLTKYVVLFVTLLQLSLAYYLRSTPILSPLFLITAYIIGGTANQNTFLAIHEITHNLAFKGVKANRIMAIVANLPIGVPFAMMFKKYHIEHHKFLAVDGIDTDMPSKLELIVLRNVFGKAFFATFQILFYALRPGFIKYQAPTKWIGLNLLVQFSFNALLVKYAGWNSLWYLIISSFMAGSLHPCAGHFIAEHYLFEDLNQETWSYYGPLNILAYNVGYHNEHHDFPSIPWTRLPKLREIAGDFYDVLPNHTSWPMVTIRFIFDGKIGMWSRVRRVNKKDGVKCNDGGGGKDGLAGGLKDE